MNRRNTDDMGTVVLRPQSGPWLAGAVGVMAVVGIISLLTSTDARDVQQYGPLLLLGAVTAWAVFWRPAVTVNDAGVSLRNVLRTIDLPWPSIHRIDTRYALTLYTAYGRYAAWAAPAPSRSRVAEVTGAEVGHLPESTYAAGGSVRPGDLPGTSSGQAAAVVRRRWEALRDAGHLDDARLERDRPVVQWHWWTIGVLAALSGATVVGFLAHG